VNAAVGSAIVRATNGGKIIRTEWKQAKISALLFILCTVVEFSIDIVESEPE
jgi:hypothetical protein